MLWYWGGRKLPQTASDSATDLKLVETDDDLHASGGLVNDITLEMHSSGNMYNKSTASFSVDIPNQQPNLSLTVNLTQIGFNSFCGGVCSYK
jgi:hypothetical protein